MSNIVGITSFRLSVYDRASLYYINERNAKERKYVKMPTGLVRSIFLVFLPVVYCKRDELLMLYSSRLA